MDENKKRYERRYQIAVYSLIGLAGIVLVLFPILRESQGTSAMLLNLGTELVGGSLIFFVLHFFFFSKEEAENYAANQRLILLTLKELGLDTHKVMLQNAVNIADLANKRPISYSSQDLDTLILKYTRYFEHESKVGVFETTKLKYFIDFMGLAENTNQLRTMSDILCCHLIDVCTDPVNPIHFSKIAAPKAGNPALALLVSIQLEKPCVFINLQGNPLASDTIDGTVEPEDTIVIIHDVVASGKLIVLCANELLKKGVKVEHVFVLVERTDRQGYHEKTPSELLQLSGIRLHALRHLSDADLANRLKQNRLQYRNT